jgi:repressor of nif and glnA expression
MALLLAILDVLAEHGGQCVNTRHIAAELVFPGAQIPDRAIEWKSSSLRRQTQRLIAAAKSMRDGGYRHLLHGQVAAVTALGGSGPP